MLDASCFVCVHKYLPTCRVETRITTDAGSNFNVMLIFLLLLVCEKLLNTEEQQAVSSEGENCPSDVAYVLKTVLISIVKREW